MAYTSQQEAEKKSVQRRFGKNLAAIRNDKGMTQEKFSFALKVDRTYVSYIERGERNPSLYVLWRMARVLKVRLSDLMDI